MKRKSIQPFYGILTIGLEIGYEKVKINEAEIITFIQAYQDELIKNKQIYLSVSISHCTIVLSGQIEPHLKISFINYPKFELPTAVLKFEIEELSKQLQLAFKQNRVVIEYLDEVIMLENSEEIDPRIQQSTTA
jgi:hypothetical protein